MKRNTLTCIESFCGAGGLALGLGNAGFDVNFSFDLNEKAVETYNQNIAEHCEVLDIQCINSFSLLETLNIPVGELDLFAGGPPCQGFSKQKRNGFLLDDPRNLLIKEYIRLVKEMQPKTFLLENVAIFGQKRGKKYLDELSFSLDNYYLYPDYYNSADYGLAQKRQRFILVAVRKDVQSIFKKPPPTVRTYATIKEAISDLPDAPIDGSEHPDFYNHRRTLPSDANIKRFSFVPQGGGWQDIPWEHRLDCHKVSDPKTGGWTDVFGRLHWDGQCPTITAGFDNFSRGRYGHPEYDRAITPREAARLQGFPDEFKFYGNRADVRLQIGNAVPPPMAEAIGSSLRETIYNAGNTDQGELDAIFYRQQELGI